VGTIAVLPVKRFGAAKQRLGVALAPEARRELAQAMVADVLDALGAVPGLDGVLVVTGEPLAAAAAAERRVAVLHDPADAGQSAAAALGIAEALRRGAARVLLVPGDCPALDAAEVGRLLGDGPPGPSVTVVPDRHGSGTNALLLAPPAVIAPAFGPGSRARHEALAVAAGATCAVTEVASLGLDVDTPEDLRALRDALAGNARGAARTRATLERLLAGAEAA
jgi:2-phospho-L-lactate/phosphoenolpyruvate guanylyltransferase